MADVKMEDLKPNSHAYKAEIANRDQNGEDKPERLRPVVSRDKLVSTKKSMFQKIAGQFFDRDAKDIKTWLIQDVLIPTAQDTILDMIQMMFFGEVNRGRYGSRSRERDRDGRTNYRSCYRGESYGSRSRRSSRRDEDRYYREDDRIDCRNIVLRNRADAEDVIDGMRDRLKRDGTVSVADLLDLVDLPGDYTDNNWGWDHERDFGIKRVSSGFLIDVVEPRYLD